MKETRIVDGAETMDKRNVVLIGMPGAGKSTVGVVLAKIVNKGFVDADLVIQSHYGKTLHELIEEHGAEGFVRLENEVLIQLEAENSIIATGGSAVYSEGAMCHLSNIGTVVYLKISYDSLVDRLGDLQDRGVVMMGGAGMGLRELYDERLPLYERYADVIVNVDDLSITAAARRVVGALR